MANSNQQNADGDLSNADFPLLTPDEFLLMQLDVDIERNHRQLAALIAQPLQSSTSQSGVNNQTASTVPAQPFNVNALTSGPVDQTAPKNRPMPLSPETDSTQWQMPGQMTSQGLAQSFDQDMLEGELAIDTGSTALAQPLNHNPFGFGVHTKGPSAVPAQPLNINGFVHSLDSQTLLQASAQSGNANGLGSGMIGQQPLPASNQSHRHAMLDSPGEEAPTSVPMRRQYPLIAPMPRNVWRKNSTCGVTPQIQVFSPHGSSLISDQSIHRHPGSGIVSNAPQQHARSNLQPEVQNPALFHPPPSAHMRTTQQSEYLALCREETQAQLRAEAEARRQAELRAQFQALQSQHQAELRAQYQARMLSHAQSQQHAQVLPPFQAHVQENHQAQVQRPQQSPFQGQFFQAQIQTDAQAQQQPHYPAQSAAQLQWPHDAYLAAEIAHNGSGVAHSTMPVSILQPEHPTLSQPMLQEIQRRTHNNYPAPQFPSPPLVGSQTFHTLPDDGHHPPGCRCFLCPGFGGEERWQPDTMQDTSNGQFAPMSAANALPAQRQSSQCILGGRITRQINAQDQWFINDCAHRQREAQAQKRESLRQLLTPSVPNPSTSDDLDDDDATSVDSEWCGVAPEVLSLPARQRRARYEAAATPSAPLLERSAPLAHIEVPVPQTQIEGPSPAPET